MLLPKEVVQNLADGVCYDGEGPHQDLHKPGRAGSHCQAMAGAHRLRNDLTCRTNDASQSFEVMRNDASESFEVMRNDASQSFEVMRNDASQSLDNDASQSKKICCKDRSDVSRWHNCAAVCLLQALMRMGDANGTQNTSMRRS